jgi:hypothetical protein
MYRKCVITLWILQREHPATIRVKAIVAMPSATIALLIAGTYSDDQLKKEEELFTYLLSFPRKHCFKRLLQRRAEGRIIDYTNRGTRMKSLILQRSTRKTR